MTAAILLSACAEKADPLQAWLLCDDCAGRLDAVVARGDGAVDSLGSALRQGPSADARANYRAQVAEELRLRRRGGGRGGGTLSAADSAAFVTSALNNLVATYQKRAALALRTIASPKARQVLHDARLNAGQFAWSADVLALVEQLDANEAVTGVTVLSPVVDVPVGGSATVSARVDGVGQYARTVTWSVSNPVLGTITPGGVFTRVGPGPVAAVACSTVNPRVCGFTGFGPP